MMHIERLVFGLLALTLITVFAVIGLGCFLAPTLLACQFHNGYFLLLYALPLGYGFGSEFI